MTITIRPAAVADITAVGQVHTLARTAAYRGFVPDYALRSMTANAISDWWLQRLTYERETHRMAVAQDDAGSVVGFSYVGPSVTAKVGELYAIHVLPERQGSGIGQALMAGALHSLRELEQSRAVLWVLTNNLAARRFYESGGWRVDGVRREAPVGPALTKQVRYCRPLYPGHVRAAATLPVA